ncbi:hypothetical protein JVU11DRAFT_7958 [Chiua virens]|nr:hypothetical protein JVU11DRAFT_7958 [Chiua virens]
MLALLGPQSASCKQARRVVVKSGDMCSTKKDRLAVFPIMQLTSSTSSTMFRSLFQPATSPMAFEADEQLPSLPSSGSSNGDVATLLSSARTLVDIEMMDEDAFEYRPPTRPHGGWPRPVVDEWSYGRVRDAIQSRWISFAWGERPWDNSHGKIFVFGPEGETGERSAGVFEGRRRRKIWEEVFRPLGSALVHKVGHELSNGPTLGAR